MLSVADDAQQGLFDAHWCGQVVPADSFYGLPAVPVAVRGAVAPVARALVDEDEGLPVLVTEEVATPAVADRPVAPVAHEGR